MRRRVVCLALILCACRAPTIVLIDAGTGDSKEERTMTDGSLDATALDATGIDVFDASDAGDAGDAGDGALEDRGMDASDASDGASFDALLGDAGIEPEFIVSPSCADRTTAGCWRTLIRGGRFSMGSAGAMDALPVQTGISVGDFYLDSTEVTVERFRHFARAMQAEDGGTREFRAVYPNGSEVVIPSGRVQARALQSPLITSNSFEETTLDGHPINAVSWYVAMAFCIWDGGRLPTEAEYEWVSRWVDTRLPQGRTFAWGATDPAGRCDQAHWMLQFFTPGGMCTSDNMRATVRVGSKPRGRVGYEEGVALPIYDLSGNVAEWLADTALPYAAMGTADPCWGREQHNPFCNQALPAERSFRGGSALASAGLQWLLMGATRRSTAPTAQEPMFGFRCARDR